MIPSFAAPHGVPVTPPEVRSLRALHFRMSTFNRRPLPDRDAELAAIRSGAQNLGATELSWVSRFLEHYQPEG